MFGFTQSSRFNACDSAEGFEHLRKSLEIQDMLRFHCHSEQGKVFAELFDKEPNADKLEIKYLAPEALEAFLEYLYLGKYLTFGDKFFQLLALASRFKVSSLKELMMDSVPSQLTDRNALQVFSLAHSLESIELKRIAFERIQQMMPGISLSDFLFDDLALLTELVEAKQKFVAVLQKVQEKSQK
jgi:hypothetical protein